MRVAVIGCGFFAQNHLHGWRDLAAEGVELVAVCDIDAKKAEEAARTFAAPRFYTDAGALLDKEKVDFVDIVTRMENHLHMVEIAAGHGVDIILQKPLASDWNEACKVVEIARKAGVRLAIHENFRWQSPMRKLKDVLDSGAIGRPTWARIAFRTGYDIYAVQPYLHQAKRYAILDVGIHMLDLARFFLGDVERVSCETQTRNPGECRRGHSHHHDASPLGRGQHRGVLDGVANRPRSVPGDSGHDRRRARLGLRWPGSRRAHDLERGDSRRQLRLPAASLDFAALAYGSGERAADGGSRSCGRGAMARIRNRPATTI